MLGLELIFMWFIEDHNFYKRIICIIFIKMAKYLETEERFVEKNSLSIYYKEVGKTPLLKKAGKKYYGKRLIEGDKKAKDEAKDIFVKTCQKQA